MLAGIGIIKGKPFLPDEHAKAILDAAAKTAFKMSKVLAFNDILTKPASHIYRTDNGSPRSLAAMRRAALR